ncbi:Predicted dehydrogenase [Alteromonadaceae bacterium Bs31]|nr:Predicted dehydrogenase [Alteromonadaceae bacterium Bs31]
MTGKHLRWGILSTAKIAREKLIPALHSSAKNTVNAIASRNLESAESCAKQLGIPTAFGDYQHLLDSPDIDAIYNPLPNHLHVPWTIRAIEAGKHVLCEKPIGLDAADTENLLAHRLKHPQVQVMEAFMYRFHPQWAKARELLAHGEIGKISSIEAVFTYFNRDAKNVRNMATIGGGGLLDIGCYCISAARFLLESEPSRAVAALTIDPEFQTDCHSHAILDFGEARANIFCSTQSEPSQRVTVWGEHGSLLIDMPFYQPENCMASLRVFHNREEKIIETEACNHYEKQLDAFADAVLNGQHKLLPLEDSLANMKVIDAIFKSNNTNTWVTI